MKILIYHLFCAMCIINVTNLFSQIPLKQSTKKTTHQNISLMEYKPLELSRRNQILIKKKSGDITEYFISKMGINLNSIDSLKKEKVFSLHKNDQAQFMQFSKSGGQIIYRREKNSKKVWEIYDIDTKQKRTIESNEGAVDVASIYDMNNILYRIHLNNDRPKIYLIKDNEEPIFIDNGFGVQWSNDKKYFLCETYQNKNLSLFEKKNYGKISKDEYRQQLKKQGGPRREIFSRYTLYNSSGEKLLILKDFDLVDWIQWAPDATKIVLKERSDQGFKILYLNYITENDVEVKKVFHFPGFSKITSEISTICMNPIWSPNGTKILFTTEVEDGHSILYNNVYILEDNSYQYIPINVSTNDFVSKVEWISNQTVLLIYSDVMTKESFSEEINIE